MNLLALYGNGLGLDTECITSRSRRWRIRSALWNVCGIKRRIEATYLCRYVSPGARGIIHLDGQDGKADEIRPPRAAVFTGWETDNQKFETQMASVVEALRADERRGEARECRSSSSTPSKQSSAGDAGRR